MAHYFFDILNDVSNTTDHEGLILPDDASARRVAEKAIAAIMADEIALGKGAVHLTVNVNTGESRVHLFSVKTEMQLVHVPPIGGGEGKS